VTREYVNYSNLDAKNKNKNKNCCFPRCSSGSKILFGVVV
jgi:hypothetical protein